MKLPVNPTPEQFNKIAPLLVKTILGSGEYGYPNEIDDLTWSLKGTAIVGQFASDDEVYEYEISDDRKSYRPIRGVQDLGEGEPGFQALIARFALTEEPEFAKTPSGGKRKTCKKGYPCGNSCIATNKKCNSLITKQEKEIKQYVSKKASSKKTSPAKSSATPPVKAKPTQGLTDSERKAYRELLEKSGQSETIQKVKENFLPPPRLEETVAIYGYTGSDYSRINWALRSGKVDDEVKLKAKVIQAGLEQLPAFKGTTYRSAWLPQNIIDQYEVGKEITEKGFTSTTRSKDMMFDAIENESLPAVRYTIASKSGRMVEFHSNFPEEKEVLFGAGTRFKIKGKTQTDKGFEIELEEI